MFEIVYYIYNKIILNYYINYYIKLSYYDNTIITIIC